MHLQDLLAPLDIGVGHLDLAVETARAQQRRIEHIRPVGGGHDDDALVGLETVHLHQKLVERLFALVVAATVAHPARAADRIDLVDEDDAGGVLLGLFEHVAHTGCADAHEHFHEIGTGNGEERHARLAGDGAGQKGFAGARRAHQQRPLGNLAAQARKLLRVAKKLDDLLQLFLGLVDAGHVVEGDAPVLFGQQLGPALAKAHGPAAPAALHAVHEIDPHADQQQERQEGQQNRYETRLFLRLDHKIDVLLEQELGDVRALGADGHIVLPVGAAKHHPLAIERNTLDIARIDRADEFGIADGARVHRRLSPAEQIE